MEPKLEITHQVVSRFTFLIELSKYINHSYAWNILAINQGINIWTRLDYVFDTTHLAIIDSHTGHLPELPITNKFASFPGAAYTEPETTMEPEFLIPDIKFPWTEYIFFGLTLAASLGIGIFYGFFGKANKTNEEFLMAGRSMGVLPVTLSLICSFISAITLLGHPVEIYLYGIQYVFLALSVVLMTLALMFIYVPVYFRLQLTSAYEYFEWRFSRRVRLTMSVMAIFHLMFYMPTTVYGPSLALDQVAGINTWVSCSAIFVVCVIYSSMGGLKAVLWTDALQAVVMVVSLVAVIGAGMKEIGGFSVMWERSGEAHRTTFFLMDPDPRTRHTFWTDVFGGMFVWLPLFAASQAQIQRYNSVPTLAQSTKTQLFNMFGLIIVIVLCSWIGLIMFTYYYDCDPAEAGIVDATDQLLPLFVIEVLGKYPGIPGLLVAGLTCGSLSSVSSALNSLTALITEDFVKARRPGLSEERLAVISKIISGVTGTLALALVFVIAEVNKTVSIQPFSTLIHGALLGPILAAFSLGIFFPWTEEIGIFVGLIVSLVVSGVVGIGGILAGREDDLLPDQRLSLRTDGCELVNPGSTLPSFLSSSTLGRNEFYTPIAHGDWKAAHEDDSAMIKIWSVAYQWQPLIFTLTTFFVGMFVSGIVVASRKGKQPKVNESLLGKPFVKLWRKVLGKEYVERWIDFDSPPFSGDPAAKAAATAALNKGNNNGSSQKIYSSI